jgi:predicted ferric reductase
LKAMKTRRAAIARITIYILLIAGPVIYSLTLPPETEHKMHGFVEQFASAIGLLAFSILALQFILAARIRWIEWPFGLDILYSFHRAMGIFAGLLLISHPVLLAWGGMDWKILTAWNVDWPVHLGRLALLLVLLIIGTSTFPRLLDLPFESWRKWHNRLALTVLSLAFIHSLGIGGDLDKWPMRLYWSGLFATSIATYVYHKLMSPHLLRRQPYEVAEVQQETDKVWTLKLRQVSGTHCIQHLPGQFHFLTFESGNLPAEEHPFSIASSPTERSFIASTIKETGNFTSQLRQARVGDRVLVRGSFGRFSHVLHPGERKLVFLAGGIGITPMMSMLRYMRDAAKWKPCLMICANRIERDIAFREELAGMAAASGGYLRVVHVLTKPDAGWTGERGRIDSALLLRHLGEDSEETGYYVCGPKEMNEAIVRIIRGLAVPPARIHLEMFSL